MDLSHQIDRCLGKPFWTVDILPRRVEPDGPDRYLAVEDWWRRPEQLTELYRRFAGLLLKLNCYFDFQVSSMRGG